MADLTPANQNPWYVLATLYGEQEGEGIDWGLEDRNRRVWNAWACQNMGAAERAKVAKACKIEVEETQCWSEISEITVRRYEKEMRRRNVKGFVQPAFPNPAQTIDCSKVLFQAPVYFDKRTFSPAANFTGSKFAFFSSYYSCAFLSAASFDGTTFEAQAHFTSVLFLGTTSFDAVTFNTEVNYFLSQFRGVASFDRAVFQAETSFFSSRFFDDAFFTRASFKDSTLFEEVEFGKSDRVSTVGVSFSETRFEQPVSFRWAKFHQNFPDLSGAILHDTTTFTASERYWPEQIDLPEDNDARQSALEGARESAATIRHLVGKQGLPEDEHFFFRKEMGFARQIGPLWQRLPYIGFGVLSDYGYSIARPLGWLGCLFAYPLGFYGGYLAKDGAAIPAQITGALGLAFSSTFNFFGFQRTYFREEISQFDPLMSFLSGSQTVFGYILLFFLALGLRQRFRLR